MSVPRPMLDRWRSTPWVNATPVDDRSVGGILNEEVQIAVRGDGPISKRELVPITPAAHRLLYGHDREQAQRVFRGVLASLDGREGASNLRGFSLSTDQASFATNLLLSNVEAGFFPDAVAANDAAGFERSMVSLIPSVQAAKAQNTGWLDLGPRVSEKLRTVIERGTDAPTEDSTEVALTLLHELQHSVTPHDPNTISEAHVWLEEGIAETFAWWPGQAAALRARMGVPARADETIDPWSVPSESVASTEYRNRHRAVTKLLGLAGVEPRNADGAIDVASLTRAEQLLQGDVVQRVPRNLARAMIQQHDLDPNREEQLAAQIVATAGQPDAVDALEQTLVRPRGG